MGAAGNALSVLRAGDLVDVVAPASACASEHLERGVALLREWGLEPRRPPDLFGPSYIYANEDRLRWRQLRRALADPASRAVWCVRGGYGSARLLPFLARLRARPRPKLLVGLSDITALHTFLVQRWQWPTLHGPVLSQLGSGAVDPAGVEELRRVLFAEQRALSRPGLVPLNAAARGPGRIEAPVVGGNLKTLQSQLGTPWALRARGCIVLLEDVNERGYAIDRMLVQLAQSGALRGARAIVFGSFDGGLEANGCFVGTEVIGRFAAGAGFPVLSGLPMGHRREDRLVPLGMVATLELGASGRLSLAWEVRT